MIKIGSTIGLWKVLKKKNSLYFTCKCRCGTERDVYKYSLMKGKSLSCGCVPSIKRDTTSLIGKKFGEWEVKKYLGEDNYGCTIYVCQCSCGKKKNVSSNSLKSGNTKSCGSHPRKHGHTKKHSKSRTYNSWASMISRCYNVNETNFKYWGGRGITVAPEWFDFRNFLRDMGERPEGFTLDRIDVDKNYSKENCRWADWKTQANNKRKN